MLTFQTRSLVAAGATLAALASILAATPAPASAALIEQKSVVSYGDLDLARPEGVRTLKTRIGRAVERACGPAPRLEIAERLAYRACRTEARADALAQVRRAELAAHHARVLAAASE